MQHHSGMLIHLKLSSTRATRVFVSPWEYCNQLRVFFWKWIVKNGHQTSVVLLALFTSCGPFGGCSSHFTCPLTGLCLVFDDQERTGLVVTLHTSEKCRSPFLYKHTVKATNKLLNISSAMWKKMLLIELKLIVCDNISKRQKSNSEAL